MRKVPLYLEALLEKVAIIGFAFLLFYLAIRFVPVAHLNPKISDQIPLVSLFTGLVFGYFIWESRDWWNARIVLGIHNSYDSDAPACFPKYSP
jgi:hypothetical protein